ncbi:peptide-methionine (S)-S-oxide reductase [Bacillus tianshenii]|uniref:peptide-methionine (S)-S-oxide reductase n=1 Tax=Sutcliffiella tianshenii TaxID=1463404 RepID=A0ABS2P2U6_9BACI|nr:peptide-methionine (S)-S-oxide reductase [Bacillus tianshenii]
MIRTRVGYAGGTTPNPTYKQMVDHTECLEVDFDPLIIGFEEIVKHFWRSHNPNRGNYKGRQYLSIILFHDAEQKEVIERVKESLEKSLAGKIDTEIASYRGFTLAEERHQKYYLKRYPKAMERLLSYYETHEKFVDGTLVARLNSFVKGYGTLAALKEEMAGWNVPEDIRVELFELIDGIRW